MGLCYSPDPLRSRVRNPVVSAPRRNILVVDDDPAVRQVTSEMLEPPNCLFQVVSSGEEALAACNRQRFDAALLDLAMPDMSGGQLYSALREQHYNLPVIIMTGLNTTSADELLKDGTPTWLLGKLFSVAELRAIMAKALPV